MKPFFVVTDHARERMLERKVCRHDKLLKVTKKAWYSRQTHKAITTAIRNEQFFQGPDKKEYRFFSGIVFVFAVDKLTVKLVTVFYPREM